MSVVLSEHLPLLASAPNGIQKLRGLIYELAARGKLTDPDSGTPASSVQLGEVAEFVMGQAPPGSECNTNGIGTIFVKTGEFGEEFPVVREWTTKPLKFAKRGDVLICVVGATVGKLNMAIECAIGRSVAAIRPCNKLDSRYLYVALVPFTLRLRSQSRGSAQGVIGKAELGQVEIRYPSLAEQHRIVAKVDELMALCDRLEQEVGAGETAHAKLVETLLGTLTQSADPADLAANWQRLAEHFDTLFTSEASINALKQTVLQLAVMGKLVPQDSNDEPASELLKRIAKVKDRLSREEGLRTTAEDQVSADEHYIDIPDGWTFLRLGNLAKFIDYRGRTPDKISSGIPLITAKNVRFGFISREPREFVSEKEYQEWMTRGFPRVGDILFTTEAPLGNVAIVDIEDRFALAQRVICFQFHEPQIASYLRLALMSEQVRRQISEEATGMTATGIKASRLKEIPLPLPPLAEQNRIVAKVDELMALCDHLKADLAEARTQQVRLSASLIESALQAA